MKKAVVAYFELLSHHLPGGAKENLDKCKSSWAPGRILSPISRKYYPLGRKIRNDVINFYLNLTRIFTMEKIQTLYLY
jgi:hypothetical protein